MIAFLKLLQFDLLIILSLTVWGPFTKAFFLLLRMWMCAGNSVSRSPGRRSASTILALGISGEQYFLQLKMDRVSQNSVVIQNSAGNNFRDL